MCFRCGLRSRLFHLHFELIVNFLDFERSFCFNGYILAFHGFEQIPKQHGSCWTGRGAASAAVKLGDCETTSHGPGSISETK